MFLSLAALLFTLSDIPVAPAEAVPLPDGLITQRLVAGTGTEKPVAGDLLVVRYTLWRPNGTVEKIEAPRKAKITLAQMLPGWREAAMMMVVGEKRRAWVPHTLGAGKIPEGQSYVIDTELVEFYHAPETPADLTAPPADATRTESGLAYKVLRAGTGTDHPKRHSTVTVHYTGWTGDGHIFDSTVLRGEPAEFSLDGVIKGWTEGLQLMTAGEKTRFWIPAKLAYGNERGKPQGMLVFDIELVGIK
jgi:peptidylprolyl isomerase